MIPSIYINLVTSLPQCLLVTTLHWSCFRLHPLPKSYMSFYNLEIAFQNFPYILIYFAVNALQEIKRSLIDPMRNLSNWEKGDPCTSNWTGIICSNSSHDGHFHVQELYVTLMLAFVTFFCFLGSFPYSFLASFLQVYIMHCLTYTSFHYILSCSQLMRLNLSGELAPEVGQLLYLQIL